MMEQIKFFKYQPKFGMRDIRYAIVYHDVRISFYVDGLPTTASMCVYNPSQWISFCTHRKWIRKTKGVPYFSRFQGLGCCINVAKQPPLHLEINKNDIVYHLLPNGERTNPQTVKYTDFELIDEDAALDLLMGKR